MNNSFINISQLKVSPSILDNIEGDGVIVLKSSQPYAFYIKYDEFTEMVDELERLRDLEIIKEVINEGQDKKPKKITDIL